MEIGDFAIKLGEKWGVGKAQSDNGVLLVVNPETRKMFIATGGGSEGYLTDALSRRIIENILKPGFRANANYKALDEATSAMMSILRGANFSVPEAKKEKKVRFMLVIIVVVMIIIMSSKGGNDGGYGKDGKYVNRTWPFWMGGLGRLAAAVQVAVRVAAAGVDLAAEVLVVAELAVIGKFHTFAMLWIIWKQ